MDKTLKGVVGLVGAADVELRCAALLVLAQLDEDDEAGILRPGGAMPVADRLRKDRTLEPDERYYVGFNLAEGTSDQRALAGEVLDHLAGKFGRTKVGTAARNKRQVLR